MYCAGGVGRILPNGTESGGCGAMEEFEEIFEDLEDPRTGNAKRHELHEILVIGFCTLLSGGETCADMALFGRSKLEFLQEFLRLEHGVPSHDTFSRVFRLLDPDRFHAWFIGFMRGFAETCQGVVAIDGKPPVAGAAEEIAQGLASSAWRRLSAGEGTKGARLDDWAYCELADLDAAEYDEQRSGLWTRGLLIRCNIADGDFAFFSTWCPVGTGIGTLVMIEGHRWAIEDSFETVSYTHLRAHETVLDLVCRLLLEKKKEQSASLDQASLG